MEAIYFDNAATTRALDSVIEKASEIAGSHYGNPSSMHLMGVEAEKEIKAAGSAIAQVMDVRTDEIYFTSGGTESNNLAILGAAAAYRRTGNHLITTSMEHPSVYECFKYLESEGFTVTYLGVDETGRVDIEQLKECVTKNTILVSIMQVNNETGTISDIEALSAAVKEINRNAVFHSDGVQGFCKHTTKLKSVDLYSISAHKIHGLKGTGAIYIKKSMKIKPMFYGGGQQNNLRPGTENTQGIAAFGAAATSMANRSTEPVKRIKDTILTVTSLLEGVAVNGDVNGSPFILNMSFSGVKAETLVNALAADGIYVSAGAACSSRKKGNRVIEALKLESSRVESAVRFSFSHLNTVREGERCVKALVKHVNMLRKYRARE